MAFSAQADVALRARLRDFEQEIARIPNITRKEVRQMSKAWVNAQRDMAAEARKQAKHSEAAWTKATDAVRRAVPGAGLLNDVFDAMTPRIAAVATAAAGLEVFRRVAGDVMQTRSEILGLEQATGIAAETLAGIEVAARGTGIELKGLQEGLRTFGQKVYTESKQLDDLGVRTRDLEDRLRPLNDVFIDTVEALQGVEDKQRQVGLATQLLGGKAGDLMAILGDDRLSEYVRLAEKFGVDVGPKAAQAQADWTTATGNFQLAARKAVDNVLQSLGQQGLATALDNITVGLIFSSAAFREWGKGVVQAVRAVKDGVDAALAGEATTRYTVTVVEEDGSVWTSPTSEVNRYEQAVRQLGSSVFDLRPAFIAARAEAEQFWKLADMRRQAARRPDLTGQSDPGATSAGAPPPPTVATAERMEALEDQRSAIQRLADATAYQIDSEVEGRRRQAEALDAYRESLRAARQEALATTQETLGGVSSMLGSFSYLADQVAQLEADKRGEASRTAQQMAALARAFAVFDIGVKGAQAVAAALAQTGPLAGLGVAAAVAGTVGGLIAQVRAAQMPTASSRHSGGGVGSGPAPMQQDVAIRARRGEYIVDAERVRQVGGPDALERLLRTGAAPGPMLVQLDFGDEVMEVLGHRIERHRPVVTTATPPGR